jgi:hypothetical protein
MAEQPKVLTGAPLLAMAAATGAAGLMGLLLFQPEAIIRQSFEAALAAGPTGTRVANAQSAELDHRNIWLSNSESQPLSFIAPLKVGDRIEISGKDRQRHALEVFDIRDLAAGLSPVADTPLHLLVVSCREIGGKSNRVVRFVMEADEADAGTRKVQSQRTL